MLADGIFIFLNQVSLPGPDSLCRRQAIPGRSLLGARVHSTPGTGRTEPAEVTTGLPRCTSQIAGRVFWKNLTGSTVSLGSTQTLLMKGMFIALTALSSANPFPRYLLSGRHAVHFFDTSVLPQSSENSSAMARFPKNYQPGHRHHAR